MFKYSRFNTLLVSLLLASPLTALQAANVAGKKCTYTLTSSTGELGTATVSVKKKKLKIHFHGAVPDAMYSVWVDFRSRATLETGADYPVGAIERGVAPAFKSTQGVTSGMGLDRNTTVTDGDGDSLFTVKLNYNILLAGESPVVGAELATQGLNRVGGYWMRKYGTDPATAASLQLVDTDTGLPLLERGTPAGITIVRHPDFVSHGHTPGVGGVDHFPGFKGDFPADCLL